MPWNGKKRLILGTDEVLYIIWHLIEEETCDRFLLITN